MAIAEPGHVDNGYGTVVLIQKPSRDCHYHKGGGHYRKMVNYA